MPEEKIANPWKTEADVEWLRISKQQLGYPGSFGTVYHGRVKFKGAQPKQVAVKVFHERRGPQNEMDVQRYQTAIGKLRAAGVNVVKTSIVKHNGKWVQVSEVFGSKAKNTKIRTWQYLTPADAPRFFDQIAKIYNAGYSAPVDSIGFIGKRKNRLIVHDLDLFAQMEKPLDLKKEMSRGHMRILLRNIEINLGISKKDALNQIMARVTHPEMLALLREEKETL